MGALPDGVVGVLYRQGRQGGAPAPAVGVEACVSSRISTPTDQPSLMMWCILTSSVLRLPRRPHDQRAQGRPVLEVEPRRAWRLVSLVASARAAGPSSEVRSTTEAAFGGVEDGWAGWPAEAGKVVRSDSCLETRCREARAQRGQV